MPELQIIEADLTWTGERFEKGIRVEVDTSSGLITSVGSQLPEPTVRLNDRALLPGMINAHSHAFQRGLRGKGECFPDGKGNFWSWREEMYQLVESMSEHRIYELSKMAFEEMLIAGITTVGEFHYLHHDKQCNGFPFDEHILKAASDTGIRLVLLQAFYNTGGFNSSLQGGQKQFATTSTDEYWNQMDRLESLIDTATQTLGVVAHSVRAASIEDITSLHEESKRRDMVFHIHVEEQRQEIEECQAHYQCTPMALLNKNLAFDNRFTAIHCTHTSIADMKEFLNSGDGGGNVCICPLTEANLGDGIADIPNILSNSGNICLGTDSNARISFTEEMRWLEYTQRLKLEQRGVCIDQHGYNALSLWKMATINAAQSLGINAGEIKPDYLADFITLDLQSQTLTGWTEDNLLESFIFGAGNEPVHDVYISGKLQGQTGTA